MVARQDGGAAAGREEEGRGGSEGEGGVGVASGGCEPGGRARVRGLEVVLFGAKLTDGRRFGDRRLQAPDGDDGLAFYPCGRGARADSAACSLVCGLRAHPEVFAERNIHDKEYFHQI
jgi:hypothetical protein